jgi:hypothetical protein
MPKEYDTAALLREMTSAKDDAFYVVDLSIIMGKLNRWREHLPRVLPFYAVKCNQVLNTPRKVAILRVPPCFVLQARSLPRLVSDDAMRAVKRACFDNPVCMSLSSR